MQPVEILRRVHDHGAQPGVVGAKAPLTLLEQAPVDLVGLHEPACLVQGKGLSLANAEPLIDVEFGCRRGILRRLRIMFGCELKVPEVARDARQEIVVSHELIGVGRARIEA